MKGWQIRCKWIEMKDWRVAFSLSLYTKGILQQKKNKGIWVLQLAKIPTLFPDSWRSLNEENGQLFNRKLDWLFFHIMFDWLFFSQNPLIISPSLFFPLLLRIYGRFHHCLMLYVQRIQRYYPTKMDLFFPTQKNFH